MAIITLKQLLHRPAPGGPIDPNDPLPARLYGPNGEPIGTQDDALKVTLTGSNEATTVVYGNFGQRVYFGKNGGVGEAIGPSGRIPWSLQKGKVYFWITNTRDRASDGGVRLHWFLGDQIRDDIPYTTLPNIPARATMGICVGGEPFSEGANGESPLLWVPNHGGDGVIVSVSIGAGDIGDQNVYVTGIEGGL